METHLYQVAKCGGNDGTNRILKSVRLGQRCIDVSYFGFSIIIFYHDITLYTTKKSNKYSNSIIYIDGDDVV